MVASVFIVVTICGCLSYGLQFSRADTEPYNVNSTAGSSETSVSNAESTYYDKGISILSEAFDYKDHLTKEDYINKINAAINHFNKILDLNKNSILGHKGIASAYCLIPDYNKAIKEYKLILKIKSDHFETLFNLGVVYKKLNDFKNSRFYFIKAKTVADGDEKLTLLYSEEYKIILHELKNKDTGN